MTKKPISFEPVEHIINGVGDAIADVFDQLIKGNWRDDHDHHVANNVAMHRLSAKLREMMNFRSIYMGYKTVPGSAVPPIYGNSPVDPKARAERDEILHYREVFADFGNMGVSTEAKDEFNLAIARMTNDDFLKLCRLIKGGLSDGT